MERTHLRRADRLWMPRKVRRAGSQTSAMVTGSYAALSIAAFVAMPPALFVWKLFALAGVGVHLAGRQVGNRRQQGLLEAMSCGDVPLAQLDQHGNDELVVVRGRVECDDPLKGLLHDTQGVYRRLRAGKWIHEAAVDFDLVADDGSVVPVKAAGARWLKDFCEAMEYPRHRFDGPNVSPALRERVTETKSDLVSASESVLRVGAEVQIVGYKSVMASQEGQVVDYRQAPQRAVIRSRAELPLIIVEVADLLDSRSASAEPSRG